MSASFIKLKLIFIDITFKIDIANTQSSFLSQKIKLYKLLRMNVNHSWRYFSKRSLKMRETDGLTIQIIRLAHTFSLIFYLCAIRYVLNCFQNLNIKKYSWYDIKITFILKKGVVEYHLENKIGMKVNVDYEVKVIKNKNKNNFRNECF